MTENAAVMENFIQMTPVAENQVSKSKYLKWLRKIAISHLVVGGISCVTELISLVVWRHASIYEFAIPGLVCGILWCALGAFTIAVRLESSRNRMISEIILLSISMLVALGTLAVNIFTLGLLIILIQEYIWEMLLNAVMIPCSVAGFVNSCFHIHCDRRLL